ncbi:MBL fold metallo-hydrolase [Lysobacter claricitrinus]|uniref:MBL fold metallo-hydrolase n=1 Tax=Lysobacter claricitrinus TaxID=3367728 RepID=UPI0037DAC5E3
MSAETRVLLGVSGHSHVDPRLAALPERRAGRHAFPAGWALVEHPRHGPVLFDCGYGEPARTAMQRGLRRVYRNVLGVCCPAEGDAATLLARRGIAPDDVRWIVISHFHPDHIGGLRAFPSARFVAHADAWATMQAGPLARLHAQVWRELLPDDFESRLQLVDAGRFAALDGDLASLGTGVDLFDDGSIALVDLPGHARGQIGLATHHEGTRVLLVADAFWQHAQLDTSSPLSWLARRLATHHSMDYATTLSRLRRFRDEQPAAWIIASHCARTLERWSERFPDAAMRASQ